MLADSFDRRWLLFFVQCYVITIASLLAFLAFHGQLPASLLLAFTFALGVGMALQLPTWQSLIPEVVPRDQIGAATRLDMISVNVARAVGPALAGFIIAAVGVPAVFAANAVSVVFMAVVLLLWRRPREDAGASRERFIPALRAGGRFVWHEPVVKRILLRLAMFVAPATAMWALLPIIAKQRLHLAASGYGILFAALGVGAVTGAMVIPKVKGKLSANGMLTVAALSFGVGLALTVLVPSFVVALLALVVCGLGWTATASVLVAELQMFLPQWVRARAVAVYLMTFTAAQAVASPIWGQVTQHFGVTLAICVAAGLVVTGGLAGIWAPMPDAATWTTAPCRTGCRPRSWSIRSPTPGPSPSRSTTTSHPRTRRSSSPPWPICAARANAAVPCGGSSTGWGGRQPLRGDLHGPVLGGAPAPARRPAHREDERIENAAFQWASSRPQGRHLLPP